MPFGIHYLPGFFGVNIFGNRFYFSVQNPHIHHLVEVVFRINDLTAFDEKAVRLGRTEVPYSKTSKAKE